MIIIFHGGGGTADLVMENDNWLSFADEKEFIAVFPEGTRGYISSPPSFNANPQTWNDGSERASIGAVVRNVDDVGFIEKMTLILKDTQQEVITYQFDCTLDKQLKMPALIGYGHHWPGSESTLALFLVGENSTNLNANEVIWEIFIDN